MRWATRWAWTTPPFTSTDIESEVREPEVITGIAAAEAALRYNIRPLAPSAPISVRRALEELGGSGSPALGGCLEAVFVEGLDPDWATDLGRAMEAGGGTLVISPEGRRAVLAGASGCLARAASGLLAAGPPLEDLGAARRRDPRG